MMSDPQELGSVGLLAIGVDPATSTESDWAKAAKKLQQQKSDGIVRAYYDQSYIDHLKNGDTVVTQAWSGDIFQADLNSKYRDLKLLVPSEGGDVLDRQHVHPAVRAEPQGRHDADGLLLPARTSQAVVEYYNDYVCPVPARQAGAAEPDRLGGDRRSTAMKPEIGLPTSVTANAPTVFPTAAYIKHVEELLPVQEPGRADRVEQPVRADHAGRVSRPRAPAGQAREGPRAVPAEPARRAVAADAVPDPAGRDAVAVAADLQPRRPGPAS